MNSDDVLQNVRRAREEYAALHGYDVRRIVADLQKLDQAGDWPVVRFVPYKAQSTTTQNNDASSTTHVVKNETPIVS